MLMDTNADLTEQMRVLKLKRKATSQGSKSPKGHAASQSVKHINTTPKATKKPISFNRQDFCEPLTTSCTKPKKSDLDGSMDKHTRPKLKQNSSALLSRIDKERVLTETTNLKRRISNENSPKPSHQKALIHSYLAKKNKSPSMGGASKPGMGRSASNKNFSFTTINNISMQNLINRNLSNYQMFLNKTYLGGLKDNPAHSPQSPTGASVSGIFQSTAKGSCLFPSHGLNHSSGGGSKDAHTPNFQKKLKKYINKRENVLKRAANHG